jgi:hypothetical protein
MSIVTLNDRGVRSVTTFGSLNTGSMVFIKKLTASSSSTLSFVNGTSDVVLDSTYKEYVFTFNNIHPSNNDILFQFNMSADGGSNYNVTKTTTVFRAYHAEDDGSTALEYRTGEDLAQGTGNQYLCTGQGNGNDESLVGTLRLFNPSSTTFVKHFIANFNNYHESDITQNYYIAGYANTTSAVNALQFSFGSGNIDAGDICLYGIL